MSKTQTSSLTGVETGATLVTVGSLKPFNLSYAVVTGGTSITYVVEATLNNTDFFIVEASGTVDTDGQVTKPIIGIRARSTAHTVGTLVLTILEDV